jgi:hypothetical protein
VVANSRLAEWYQRVDYTPLSLEKGVTLVKKIYLKFKQAGINVIRMGLQASEDLEDGTTVLAGPHHSAFGHLFILKYFWILPFRQSNPPTLSKTRLPFSSIRAAFLKCGA